LLCDCDIDFHAMAKFESINADSTPTSVQASPLLAEALAVQDDCMSITSGGDTRHLDVLKNQTNILLDQLNKNIVSYAMRTELLYKYFYDITHNWTMPNTNSSLCERKAQDIDLSGVIDCCFRHAIHPEWNMQSDESKNHLFSALKQMKEVYAAEDSVLIDHLMNVCRNPWTLDVVKDVLSGSKGAMTETSNALITQESPSVRLFRLETLLDSNLPKLAFNYGKFSIEHELQKTRSTVGCEDVSTKEDFTLSLQISLFITLATRLKKTKEVISMILGLPRPALHASILLRIMELDNGNGKVEHREAVKLICNCVCHLINEGGHSRIASVAFIKQMFDTNLPLVDEDLLTTITENCRDSTAIYLIANCMWKKYGKSKLCEILRLFNRGLNTDLNMVEILKARLEQEKGKNEEAAETLRLLDGTMAEAYRDLANVLRDHDIWYRECILTSFSLVPSHSLLNEIEKCAERADPKSKGETKEKNEVPSNGVRGEEKGASGEALSSDPIVSWDTFKSLMDTDKFNDYCRGLETSLSTDSFSRGCVKLRKDGARPSADSKIIHSKYTLDGLLSIEGSVLTSSLTYNPLADPMSVFCIDDVPTKLISDLLIVVNSPRWHLLSWVHPWKVLQERCQHMLKSPLNRGSQELKYLVIDYTQFDDWSSDEEFEIVTGIEPGYESWEELSDDDDDDDK